MGIMVVQSDSDARPVFDSQSFNGKETISFDGVDDGLKLTKTLLGKIILRLSLLKADDHGAFLSQYKVGPGGMSLNIYQINYGIGCVTKTLK